MKHIIEINQTYAKRGIKTTLRYIIYRFRQLHIDDFCYISKENTVHKAKINKSDSCSNKYYLMKQNII